MEFILTGGTIDSYYDPDLCTAVCHKHSVLRDYLQKTVGLDTEAVVFTEICMKDSRAITDEDRAAMVKAIETSKEKEFVVAHGTYTLFETAQYIQKHLKRKDAKVTVTGALIPLTGFAPTDAGFNVGSAMMHSRMADPGVYVFIKGRICDAGRPLHLHS